jgi:hypothetical protein
MNCVGPTGPAGGVRGLVATGVWAGVWASFVALAEGATGGVGDGRVGNGGCVV